MSKALVLAEKPSVGRDIARVLNCKKKANGYFEGNKYIVTWALGHLVTLSEPERYDKRYKEWRLEDLPILPQRMKLQVIPQTRKQFNTVKSLLERNDVQQIIIATDAGREGELVARWILDMVSVKKPIKRLWISSVTDGAIRQGFQKLKDGRETYSLYQSAKARAIADWMVGINATRALTTKFNAQLSCGRVQTPTLHLVKMREDAIRNFKPKTYYQLNVNTHNIKFTWVNSKNQTQIFNEKTVNQLYDKVNGKEAKVVDIRKKKSHIPSPLLYDLTELQREANERFGFSAKKTLNIAQALYERHKVLTYPRTDSRYLSSDILPTIKERLHAVKTRDNEHLIDPLLKQTINKNKRYFNDQKVSDHHAIIPTEEKPNYLRLTNDERLIYDLVVHRFISMLMPTQIVETTTITLSISGETFKGQFDMVKRQGWKQIDSKQPIVSKNIALKTGDVIRQIKVLKVEGETKPPAYFTEATLLSAMENPRPFMKTNNQKLLSLIGESGGLGTVATRADIIEKLLNTGLIEKRGKSIHTTMKGKQLLSLVPDAMKSPELTAKWENELLKIEKRKLNPKKFIQEITKFAVQNVQSIKSSDHKYKHDNLTTKVCPDCGKYLLEIQRKDRKMLVCQDRSCGYRKTVSQLTNIRCPECRKRLERYGEKDNVHFICVCGYRENLANYQKRKQEAKKHISTREARRLLEKENKKNNVVINTALYDAMKALKEKANNNQ